MWLALVIALVSTQEDTGGPINAFEANYAALRVELDFTCTGGVLIGPRESVWSAKTVNFTPKELRWAAELVGHWACDGTGEHCVFSSPENTLRHAAEQPVRVEQGKAVFEVPFVPRTEMIFDRDMEVAHTQNRLRPGVNDGLWGELRARTDCVKQAGVLTEGRSPFYWGLTYSFPQIVTQVYGAHRVESRSTELDGIPVELQVYRIGNPDEGCEQLEIAFDRSIGYVPRLVRQMSYGAHGGAVVKDVYIVTALPCTAGGFVPTEWYAVSYLVPRFRESHGSYQAGDDLKPKDVDGARFLASNIKDTSEPVAIHLTRDVHTLIAIGGEVPLRHSEPLTLSRARSLLGHRLTRPRKHMVPTLDVEDLRRFADLDSTEPDTSWTGRVHAALTSCWGIVAAAGLLVIVLVLGARYACGKWRLWT